MAPVTAFEEPSDGRRRLDLAVDLGSRARAWLESALGRAVCAKYESARVAALEGLADVDPTNTPIVASLQRRVHAIDLALRWLAEIIEEGEEAMTQLEQSEYDTEG